MIILIDNYDSFTYNVYHSLGQLGSEIKVFRNDEISVKECHSLNPEAIVISPGPCTPTEAGISVDLISKTTDIPILGICLGHQSIGQAFGACVIQTNPWHGKVDQVRQKKSRLLDLLPQTFTVTRYHSLIVAQESLPKELCATAFSSDGHIMALEHESLPIYGVQFHPESIASEGGQLVFKKFWDNVQQRKT